MKEPTDFRTGQPVQQSASPPGADKGQIELPPFDHDKAIAEFAAKKGMTIEEVEKRVATNSKVFKILGILIAAIFLCGGIAMFFGGGDDGYDVVPLEIEQQLEESSDCEEGALEEYIYFVRNFLSLDFGEEKIADVSLYNDTFRMMILFSEVQDPDDVFLKVARSLGLLSTTGVDRFAGNILLSFRVLAEQDVDGEFQDRVDDDGFIWARFDYFPVDKIKEIDWSSATQQNALEKIREANGNHESGHLFVGRATKLEDDIEKPQDTLGLTEARVSRVIDGDTIELTTGERVRFIGVDAPEAGEPGGSEATEFVRSKIGGQTVWLESDGNDTDRFDRLRRYVWIELPTDLNDEEQIRTKMLNAMLLEEGHATVMIVGTVKHERLFRSLEVPRVQAETPTQTNYEQIVYWVSGGEVWHSRENCRSLSRSTNIQSGTIEQSNRDRPCSICN